MRMTAEAHPTTLTESREIVPYIRRDDISWRAGCRFEPQRPFEMYIRETPCFTRWGATFKARRMAKKARDLRARDGLVTVRVDRHGPRPQFGGCLK